MIVGKPFIKTFKGIPVYISYFVLYRTRNPMIKMYALSLNTSPLGTGSKKIDKATQTLDGKCFLDASFKYITMLDKMNERRKENE